MPRIALAAVALTALAVAGCGGGEDTGVASLDDAAVSSTTPEAGILTMEESVLAFTQCLRDRGLDVADPVFDGEGGFALDSDAWTANPTPATEAALAACEPLIAGVLARSREAAMEQADDRMYAFGVCMREHGIAEWPDPEVGGSDPDAIGNRDPGSAGPAVDPDDPAVLAAMEACGGAEFGLGPKGMEEPEPGK